MSHGKIIQATALEWDYRTEQAKRACEEAFAPLRGSETLKGEILGFQQPIKITADEIVPLSSYDIVTQGKGFLGDAIIETLREDVFASVSKAVFASHLGNRDLLLHSRIDQITEGGWPSCPEMVLTVLRDLAIFTPRYLNLYPPEGYIPDKKLFEAQEKLNHPAVCVIIVPPSMTNHERAYRLRQLIYATQVGQMLVGSGSLSVRAPLHIHPPFKDS
jgi:hypothetical protein